MYKVLFVDDEPWVIIDILHSIPWARLGFEVIGHYENPREAKAVILETKPQLAFVDINMPVMNGFELIRQCREEGSESAFVILSAYSDFEFAKQAIKAAVLDYCLKPVNPVALIKTLEEIRKQLDEKEAIRAAEAEAENVRRRKAYMSQTARNALTIYSHTLPRILTKNCFYRNWLTGLLSAKTISVFCLKNIPAIPFRRISPICESKNQNSS
jgi:YesN/AraC family two-component response regulator